MRVVGDQSESSYAQINHQRIEYKKINPVSINNDRVLVLLHEGLGSVEAWQNFPDQLAEVTGSTVLIYSRLGYGQSDPCSIPRPLSYMHDEAQVALPELLKQLCQHDQKFLLLGHSDGASIAAIFGGRNPPPNLQGLILFAPHFVTEQVAVSAIETAKHAFESGDLRQKLQRYHGNNVDIAFNGWCNAWLDPEFRNWNITSYLSDIRVPVKVIQGKQDQYGSSRQIEIAEAHVQARLETNLLDNCRHSPHREQTEVVLNLVDDFIRTLDPEN